MPNRNSFLWLMALVIVAAVAGTAMRPICTNAADAEKVAAKAALLDRLKVGDAIAVDEKQGRYQLGIYPKTFRPLSHSVVEVGTDFVVVRDLAGVTDTAISIYSISGIKTLRIGDK